MLLPEEQSVWSRSVDVVTSLSIVAMAQGKKKRDIAIADSQNEPAADVCISSAQLPAEIAATVSLLPGKQSGHTTAQHMIIVDGGYTHLDRTLT